MDAAGTDDSGARSHRRTSKGFHHRSAKRIGGGAELLQTSIEDLKTRIVEKLNPPAKAAETRKTKRPLKTETGLPNL